MQGNLSAIDHPDKWHYASLEEAMWGISPDAEKVKKALEACRATWTNQGWWSERAIFLEALKLSKLPLFYSELTDFSCAENKLTNLIGSPKKVDCFFCDHNYLTSLKGGPTKAALYSCGHNFLTSLSSAPSDIRSLWAHYNFISLEEANHYQKANKNISCHIMSQKDLCPKSQKRPYGDLHPSEVNWGSIEQTKSRGYPTFEGVLEPKGPKGDKKEKNNMPKSDAYTSTDYAGAVAQEFSFLNERFTMAIELPEHLSFERKVKFFRNFLQLLETCNGSGEVLSKK